MKQNQVVAGHLLIIFTQVVLGLMRRARENERQIAQTRMPFA